MSVGVSRRRFGVALWSSRLGCAPSWPSSASAAMKLRIAYNPNPTNTTIVVAQQQGFFKQNGLNVKLTASNAAAALLPALGKQFDLITTTPTDVAHGGRPRPRPDARQRPDDRAPTKLRSSLPASAPRTSPRFKDLKGKKIAVPSLAGALYASTAHPAEQRGPQGQPT